MNTLRQRLIGATFVFSHIVGAIRYRRLLSVTILLLMAISAQSERLEWDYSAIPVLKAITTERDPLILMKGKEGEYLLTRIIIDGSSAEDWTEALEISNTKKRGQPTDVVEWYEMFKLQWEDNCDSDWNILEESEESIIFERHSSICPSLGAQQALCRVLFGKTSVYLLCATSNGGMDAETRDRWTRVFETAEIKASRAAVSARQLKKKNDRFYTGISRIPYTGPQRDYFPDGQTHHEGDFVNGKPEGVRTVWYAPVQHEQERNDVTEKRDDADWTEWHAVAQKHWEINYANGKRDGLYTEWHENGQNKEESNYVSGKLDGLRTVWHENGQKEFEGNYRNGKEQRGSKWWDENGVTKKAD